MPVISFNEWSPDAAAIGNPGMPYLRNAVPGLNSYQPFSELVIQTDALTAYPRGAIEAQDASNNVYQYAGDETKLYSLSGGVWNDVTRSSGGNYATGTEEGWEFVRWKEKVLATNFSDDPQSISFGTANFAAMTTDLRMRHIAVVRDYVVAGNTFDSVDGTVRDRLRWSGNNDETDWTVSPVTGSDYRDLKKGGGIQRIIGGDFGIICCERNTWAMSYVGSPTFFVIDEVLPGIGALAPGAVTLLADTVFMWSEHGMYALRGGRNPIPIGEGKVDQYLRKDLDEDYLYRISSVADPTSGRVLWSYPGSGNTSGRPNRIVIYDTRVNRWGIIDQEHELIWRSGGVATTLEQLDDVNLSTTERVVNGSFATDSDWAKGTGWTIAAGVASHAAGTASDLSQGINLNEGRYYRVEFDVANRTAGSVTPVLGSTSGTAITADDTDIKESIRAGSGTTIVFSATSDFDGDIDNVSVREIDDLDSMSVSLDDAQWKGGSSVLSAFDSSYKSGNFSGSPMTAVLQTRESEINAGRRTRLLQFWPLIDGGTVTGRVGYRNTLQEEVTYTKDISPRPSGKIPCRVNGKFMRYELTVSGEWVDAIGVRVEPYGARPGERR
jgi:hypothetical protein